MRPLSLPSNASTLDPENSLVLYQVKSGDSISKILNRIAGQSLSGKTLDSAIQMTKNLNPKLQNVNQISPGQWICFMHPLHGRSSLFQISDLNNFHSIWKNIDENEKSFLVRNWDTIDLLADIASRTDNAMLTAVPAMGPSLNSVAIELGTTLKEQTIIYIKQIERLILEQRKNTSRFIFQHFQELKTQRYIIISFKPGRLYSISQKLESFAAITKRLKMGLIFMGLDIAVGGIEVMKSYYESQDADQTRIKVAEVSGKIITGMGAAALGAKVCGIAISSGATLGIPGIFAGSAICVGTVITGAIAGEKIGRLSGHYIGLGINYAYHWIVPPIPLTSERSF